MVLKQGEVFVVSDDRGDIGRTVAGAGVYFRDMRYLSDYRVLINDDIPDLLDSSAEHNAIGIAQFGNPLIHDEGAEQDILPSTIGLRRYRHIAQGMLEQLDLHNFNPFPVSIRLTLTFSSDFRDIFDVRGFRRMERGRILLPRREGNTVVLAYRALDGHRSETVIRFNRPPDEAIITAGAGYTSELEELRTMLPGHDRVVRAEPAGQAPRVTVIFHVQLQPQEETRIEFTLSPRSVPEDQADDVAEGVTIASDPLPEAGARYAAITTNNALFNRLIDRSLRDIRSLVTPFGDDRVVAAGIPWFVAPFGRDSLITALQTLMYSPDLALETLRFLARHQGRKVDEWTAEEPGKILHEQRFGEMARLGEVPHVPYYGSVDSTPLFIITFCELMRWVGSQALFDEFHDAMERAIGWIDEYGDRNGDGFVDYGEPARGGLVNQGWKDSDNSLQYPDGSEVKAPIALVEVQGYVYRAKRDLADVYERYGLAERAETLRQEAEALRVRFEERYWSEADQFYGQAIDGSDRLIPGVSSNPGHCLFAGIVSPERAALVCERFTAPDMNSGWGIRTLSSTLPHYNPMSYHNGSVWPHDNSLIIDGLRRYGFDAEAAAFTSDLVDAAHHFDYGRLPELFCGYRREFERYTVPISYPVSCSPQAWAAGTIPFLLQVLLGLEPDAAANRLSLRPYLPDWLDEVQLRGIQIGDQQVNLTIAGHEYDVEVTVDGAPDLEVVLHGTVLPRK